MPAAETVMLAYIFIGYSSIAAMTWFFSSRPRLFVRVFVPPDEYREAVRRIRRDPGFGRGMRSMALLQFSAAAAFGLAGLWLWLG